VYKSGSTSHEHGGLQVELFVVELKVLLEVLISQEVACVGRDTTAGHHLGAFPEAKETLLLVKDSGQIGRAYLPSTGLDVRLNDGNVLIKKKHLL
jgi:hypothetical protein